MSAIISKTALAQKNPATRAAGGASTKLSLRKPPLTRAPHMRVVLNLSVSISETWGRTKTVRALRYWLPSP